MKTVLNPTAFGPVRPLYAAAVSFGSACARGYRRGPHDHVNSQRLSTQCQHYLCIRQTSAHRMHEMILFLVGRIDVLQTTVALGCRPL